MEKIIHKRILVDLSLLRDNGYIVTASAVMMVTS